MTLRHGLYVSGPGGVGVTSPQDARLALAGTLSGQGILNGFTVTGSTSGPNMKYTVAAGVAALQRGTLAADGLYLTPNDGPLTVDSGAPAPSSGTRWDLVYVLHKNAFDGGFSDANSDPVFGVTVGAAGASPTKPYASVPAGALVLAEASVGTNIANASLAIITQVARAAGSRLARAANSATYPASPQVGDYIDDATLGLLRWNGTGWDQYQKVSDTGWVNLTGLGGSYTTPATVAAAKAQWRIKGGIILMRGIIQTLSGSNFPASSAVTLIASGNLQSQIVPPESINRPLAATNPAAFARGILATDASLTIATSAAPGSYVDIGGFSGYTID